MFEFTKEEKKVALFLLLLFFSGIALSSLIKLRPQAKELVYPGVELAKLDLNKVSLEEMSRLKFIPKQLTRKISDYRDTHQRFTSLEELKEIKGIGPKRYEKLKAIFFVE